MSLNPLPLPPPSLSLFLSLSATRNYQNAFNDIRDLFNPLSSINPINKLLIIITDNSGYNFDNAQFNNAPPNVFMSLIYTRVGECTMITCTFINSEYM